MPLTTFSAEGHPDADWRAEDVEVGPMGCTFTAVGPKGERVAGRLAAARPLQRRQHARRDRRAGRRRASTRRPPPTASRPSPACRAGWSAVDAGQPYLAVVDYAHKTDAVESVLRALRKVTEGRMHAVLGCGGDRDRTKRGADGRRARPARRHRGPHLGQPALRGPAGDPGRDARGRRRGARPRARHVARRARPGRRHRRGRRPRRPGDTVLVAGKGHEQGQDIAGVVRPFDDREVLRAAIEHSRRTATETTQGQKQ